MAENMVSGLDDLQNWMKNLPIQLRETPIIYLAIPGKCFKYFVCLRLSVKIDREDR